MQPTGEQMVPRDLLARILRGQMASIAPADPRVWEGTNSRTHPRMENGDPGVVPQDGMLQFAGGQDTMVGGTAYDKWYAGQKAAADAGKQPTTGAPPAPAPVAASAQQWPFPKAASPLAEAAGEAPASEPADDEATTDQLLARETWYPEGDAATLKGFQGLIQMGLMTPEEAARRMAGGEITGDLVGRIGMGQSFLDQYQKEIRPRLARGDVTGLIDVAASKFIDSSSGASTLRKLESGQDALRRMLTGATLGTGDESYDQRYLPSWTDNSMSAVDKGDQLAREIIYVMAGLARGRGGDQLYKEIQAGAAKAMPVYGIGADDTANDQNDYSKVSNEELIKRLMGQ